ncbi:hypothetical protein FAUST_9035 [Fusarium austroamericanum]|uniref:Peptidase S8/S53 domain-containing protein n=1 Tax=Fusarium austroamericanum TaxID=282268 RepID=A0AAN5Z5P8_FUSAU|nr:hypothetical protein FAUST_9035 [Fusarium austroamericanum]
MKLWLTLSILPCALGALLPRAEVPAPLIRANAELIDDEYIVVLHQGHTLKQHFDQIGRDLATNATLFYPIDSINGYRAKLPHDLLHDHIRFDPGVEFVEQDQTISLINPVAAGEDKVPESDLGQKKPGFVHGLLNRLRNFRRDNWWHWQINHRDGAWYDAQKTYGKKHSSMWWWTKQRWEVLDGAGKGVLIYIVDTGMRLSHTDFQGRAVHFRTGDATSPYVGGATADDKHGHGTHVGGIAAGVRGGMAPWATLVNVKVMCAYKEPGCQGGRGGGLTQAISDITSEHNEYKKGNNAPSGWKGSVINLSLTTGDSEALRRAMKAAFDAGIPIAVAAGNEKEDTVNVVPCKYTESSVCVASSDIDYKFSTSFSNFGREVKMIAPGSEISSASIKSNKAYTWKSGTSMAAPCIAGAMAIYVSFEIIDSDVNKVYDRLVKNQLVGIISDVPSDPPTANNFVNSGINSVLKHEHEPYYGALSIDHPPGEASTNSDESRQGPKDWEEDPDAGPGIKAVGVENSNPDAVVVVTEVYTAPVETVGPDPASADDVGYEGDDISINESPPPETLECAPTDTNGPVMAYKSLKSFANEWCDSLNRGIVNQNNLRQEQVKSFGSSTAGSKLTDLVFSAEWIEDVVGDCPNRTRGTEPKHCKKAMLEILDKCGSKDGMEDGAPRYGGRQQGDEQCVIYKIEIVDKGVQTRKRGQSRA